jgi:hypothetical protein
VVFVLRCLLIGFAQDDKLIKFCAKGMSHGELKFQPIQDNDFATRTVKVEINK